MLRLDLETLQWELVDNYGDIPGVRMGNYPLPSFARHTFLDRTTLIRYIIRDRTYRDTLPR